MKTLGYFLVLAILVFAGCDKDEMEFENQDNMVSLNAKVPVQVKADCFATPDLESALITNTTTTGDIIFSHSRFKIRGNSTYFGALNPEASYYVLKSMELFTGDNGLPYTLNKGYGKFVATNGDEMKFTFEVIQSLDKAASYTGKAYIIPGSGTGKFTCCSGVFDEVGGVDYGSGGNWFKLDGYLIHE